MSKNTFATCTLIAAGLFIASVPTFANVDSNYSPSATVAASTREQQDNPSDRRAAVAERDQRSMTYGGQAPASSMKISRSKPQPTTVPIPRTSRHNNGNF